MRQVQRRRVPRRAGHGPRQKGTPPPVLALESMLTVRQRRTSLRALLRRTIYLFAVCTTALHRARFLRLSTLGLIAATSTL